MYKVYCDEYLLFDTKLEAYKIINPKLELELNKTGSFGFTIYANHPNFSRLEKLKSIITVYQNDALIFRGRILNDEQGFHNEKQVSCEGELAFLVDSIQRPYEFNGSPNDLFAQFINNHNLQVSDDQKFIVGNITVTDPNDYIARSDTQYLNTWDSLFQKLVTPLGGYLVVRHEQDGNYIDWVEDFNVLSNQSIEFGKNLLDLNKVTNGEDIATAIIPLGAEDKDTKERLTIKTVNNDVDYVFNQEAVDAYGWIFKTVTWDDVTIPSNLLTKANAYLADAMNLLVSIELSAVDLAAVGQNINAFQLGTYVPVTSTPHNLNTNFLVTKLSINLVSPGSNKLTLGTSYSTFTDKNESEYKGQQEVIKNVAGSIDKSVSDAIRETEEKTTSQIEQSATSILSSVSDNYYLKNDANTLVQSVNTRFEQTNSSFEMQFNQFSQDLNAVSSGANAQFSEIQKYIRFVDGDIVLGEVGNELTLKIQNDRISFLQSNAEVAYFSNRKLYVTDGEFLNTLKIGIYGFIPRANGNLSIKKLG